MTTADVNRALNGLACEAEATYWIERVLPLAVMATDEAWVNGALDSFIEEIDEHILAQLAEWFDVRAMAATLSDEDGDEDELRDQFLAAVHDKQRYGFLCEVLAPEVTRRGNTADVRYGMRRRRWFYDEDLAGILSQADTWARSLEIVAAGGSR